jgi:hypothetical protein
MLSRSQLIAGNAQPPQAGLNVAGQRGVAAVRAGHRLQHLSNLDQHQLVLAHYPKKRAGGLGYRPPVSRRVSRVSTKALTARSRSDLECAADTWVLIRAWPFGTTGYEKPTT